MRAFFGRLATATGAVVFVPLFLFLVAGSCSHRQFNSKQTSVETNLGSGPADKGAFNAGIFTGHSAGGALAQVMAADLTEREVEFRGLWGAQRCESLKAPTHYVTGVVTFGSPRLGDQVPFRRWQTAREPWRQVACARHESGDFWSICEG